MRNSGHGPTLKYKADQLEDAAKDFWKQEEAAGARRRRRDHGPSLRDVAWRYARKYNVKNPAITKAIGRLAYYTDIIGDAKMQQYVTELARSDDEGRSQACRTRRNQYVQTRPGLTALPASAG